eukprot:EG_transcript_21146
MHVSIRVAWLRGLALGEHQRVRAVLSLFGATHETSLQGVGPDAADDAACGTVSWSDTFWLPSKEEAWDNPSYLELAFWQYSDDEAIPTALGFTREDVTDLQTAAQKQLEVPMALEGHPAPALTRVELALVDREPMDAGDRLDPEGEAEGEAGDPTAVLLVVEPQVDVTPDKPELLASSGRTVPEELRTENEEEEPEGKRRKKKRSGCCVVL